MTIVRAMGSRDAVVLMRLNAVEQRFLIAFLVGLVGTATGDHGTGRQADEHQVEEQ